ncbi:DNA gyrase subunit A, partial [Patescibacteria group bacterium]|nr:DNA gyrase subunit A [Patescibacteria group bacterium]
AYEIPEASRTSKGKSIYNFLEIPTAEKISAVISYPKDTKEGFLVMITKNGVVKKTPLEDFENVRRTGIIALKLSSDDSLSWVKLSGGSDEIILTTTTGQAIRFKEKDIRSMGRTAGGVKGINLKKNDSISGADIIPQKSVNELKLLVVSANGFGKQTNLKEYKIQKRGGSGIKTAKTTEKTGPIIGAHVVGTETEEIIAFSSKGQAIKIPLADVRILSRATQGVKIMNLEKGDKIVGIVCL